MTGRKRRRDRNCENTASMLPQNASEIQVICFHLNNKFAKTECWHHNHNKLLKNLGVTLDIMLLCSKLSRILGASLIEQSSSVMTPVLSHTPLSKRCRRISKLDHKAKKSSKFWQTRQNMVYTIVDMPQWACGIRSCKNRRRLSLDNQLKESETSEHLLMVSPDSLEYLY